MMEDKSLGVIREFLINRKCPCGGWTCPRCLFTIKEAEELVPDLKDNIDLERDSIS